MTCRMPRRDNHPVNHPATGKENAKRQDRQGPKTITKNQMPIDLNEPGRNGIIGSKYRSLTSYTISRLQSQCSRSVVGRTTDPSSSQHMPDRHPLYLAHSRPSYFLHLCISQNSPSKTYVSFPPLFVHYIFIFCVPAFCRHPGRGHFSDTSTIHSPHESSQTPCLRRVERTRRRVALSPLPLPLPLLTRSPTLRRPSCMSPGKKGCGGRVPPVRKHC